jgi:hypothetical protein
MRAKLSKTAAPAASPLMRLTTPSAARPSERGSYTAAETIMRSALQPVPGQRTKRGQTRQPRNHAPN